jgi:hypothetical protein
MKLTTRRHDADLEAELKREALNRAAGTPEEMRRRVLDERRVARYLYPPAQTVEVLSGRPDTVA